MQETWLPVVGFEGSYEVSDHGRVRSVDRVIERRDGTLLPRSGQLLKQQLSGRGDYLTVTLCQQGRYRPWLVHLLMAKAFLGPSADLEVRHLNGNGHDNRVANLRWGTHSENMRDSLRHGTHAHAVQTHCRNDHPYTADNTYVWTDPKTGGKARHCRTCRAARNRQSTETT